MNLKERRLELKLTLKEVGEKVGVSYATISRWETGEIANMGRDKIQAYAKALKIDPADIVSMESESDETLSLRDELKKKIDFMTDEQIKAVLMILGQK